MCGSWIPPISTVIELDETTDTMAVLLKGPPGEFKFHVLGAGT
jgi:hypothetical protein